MGEGHLASRAFIVSPSPIFRKLWSIVLYHGALFSYSPRQSVITFNIQNGGLIPSMS